MSEKFTVSDIYHISPERQFSGSEFLPEEIGQLKLLRKECREKIIYYDWDLSFKNRTLASRPDNFGNDEIQVIFNMNQPINWQVDGGRETVDMQPGEVCVFRNNNYQTSMNYNSGVDFKFKSLQMPTEFFKNLLSRYFSSEKKEICKKLFLTHAVKTVITGEMFRVLSEIDSAEKYQEFKTVFLEGKMIELIALVLYGVFYNRTDVKVINSSEQIELLRQRIQFSPEEDYYVPELAENLGMSVSKFTRTFRALYGVSVHRYVMDQRLEKAASLIIQGSLNVSEAALKCGFNNLSHFAKEVQKKFGVTPKKFSNLNSTLTEKC